jgi:putative spermidine/putrescine transport system ATP-binding protein
MDHGRVAQTGKPRDIYHRPASRFVADFIGTMNILTGSSDGTHFHCSSGRYFPAELPAGIREVCFRPEGICLVEESGAGTIDGIVKAAFYLGDHTRLFVDVGEPQPLIVESTSRREFHHGDAVDLRIDPRGLLTLQAKPC